MKTLTLATAALAASMAAANAATTTLAAAPIYTSANGNSELCVITNYSQGKVKLTSVKITNDTGTTSLVLTQNTCTTPLALFASCRFAAAIPQPADAAYTCIVTTTASAKVAASLRVTNEQLDVNGTGLSNAPGY
jgi:hypothetical protein